MELKDFITASLENIADGIIESNIKLLNNGLRVLSAGMNAKTEGKYGNSLSFSIPVIYPQNYFLLSEKTFEYFPDKDKGSDSGRYIYKDI